MKYLIFIMLIVLAFSFKANSQVLLTIQKVNISSVYVNNNPDVIEEGDEDGPYVELFYCISNNSDKTVKLIPKSSKMYMNFQMKDQLHTKTLVSILFLDKDSIILNPNEQYSGSVGDYIFLGTRILKVKKKDFCIELIEAIPTIKMEYISKELRLESSGIEKVIVF